MSTIMIVQLFKKVFVIALNLFTVLESNPGCLDGVLLGRVGSEAISLSY